MNNDRQTEALHMRDSLNAVAKHLTEKNYDEAIRVGNVLRDQMIKYTDDWNTLHVQDSWFGTDLICWIEKYVKTKDRDDLKAVLSTFNTIRGILKSELKSLHTEKI